jgi:hypothetical protein
MAPTVSSHHFRLYAVLARNISRIGSAVAEEGGDVRLLALGVTDRETVFERCAIYRSQLWQARCTG